MAGLIFGKKFSIILYQLLKPKRISGKNPVVLFWGLRQP
nr:MAG TPA: hypothetical protein [Caudoviricetes sp.]